MISLPRAFCCQCRVAYKPVENGIVLAGMVENRTYYKIHSDLHECPSCGHKIYAGFGQPIESFAKDFDSTLTDLDVQI